jgi:acyl-CoA thioester hydrolase
MPMAEIFEIDVRVRYGETDQMGVVYHANYLNWFEIGRTEWLRQSGANYRRLEEDGLLLPVTEANLKYYRSAKYDDLVRVRTWIESYNKVRLVFRYEVYRVEDGELLCSGMTEHVFINRDGQVVRLNKTHPEVYELILSKVKGGEGV